MSEFVLENTGSATPCHGVPKLDAELGNAEARIILLPPGRVDFITRVDRPLLDVNINLVEHNMAVNSDRRMKGFARAESLGFFPRGTELSLETTNVLPGCVVEIVDKSLDEWLGDAEAAESDAEALIHYEPDPVAADLGRAAIQFLAGAPADTPQNRLTLESFALGISSRAIAILINKNGDADAEQNNWARRGAATRCGCAAPLTGRKRISRIRR